jgi:hypothetical protein
MSLTSAGCFCRTSVFLALFAAALPPVGAGGEKRLPGEGVEFFEKRIRPVLVERCYRCHNSFEKQRNGLAVDHRASIRKGGRSGMGVVPGDPEASPAIICSSIFFIYEIAYRMQSAVPDLLDISGESKVTRSLYGLDSPVNETAEYGRQCLLARRLVERGVRFVELTCLPRPGEIGQNGNPWDQHGKLKIGHAEMAQQVDQPIAGLIRDLKQRGLFDKTLIVWAGEFGRTPYAEGSELMI